MSPLRHSVVVLSILAASLPFTSPVFQESRQGSMLHGGSGHHTESRWQQVFLGRLAKVEADRTLYERRKDEDCFIAVRITNVTNSPIGVDLRRFWNVVYPNSWGPSKTPAPELVDEERWIRKPISEEDKKRLTLDYSDHRLTTLMPHRSINYFRGFTFGRNIRKEIDSAASQYLIVGLDGVLEMTNGETTEEAIFPMSDAGDESARWVAIQLPVIWKTIPQDSLLWRSPMKHIWEAMKRAVFIFLLSLVLPLQATDSESMKSLPKSEDIFTIAINPIPSGPTYTTRYFTPESLREALPNFKPGEAEMKAFGARRV